MRKLIFIGIVVITSVTYLNAQNSDKKIQFGGRIMYDMATWNSGDNNDNSSDIKKDKILTGLLILCVLLIWYTFS